MKIIRDGKRLRVSEIDDLAAGNSGAFQSAVTASIGPNVMEIDIDLSKTGFVDCGGVGALVALRKLVQRRGNSAPIRLLNPTSSAHKLLQLTRMDRLFPIEQCCCTLSE